MYVCMYVCMYYVIDRYRDISIDDEDQRGQEGHCQQPLPDGDNVVSQGNRQPQVRPHRHHGLDRVHGETVDLALALLARIDG